MPVLVGSGSLYIVDKSLGYGVGEIGHILLSLLDTVYMPAGETCDLGV